MTDSALDAMLILLFGAVCMLSGVYVGIELARYQARQRAVDSELWKVQAELGRLKAPQAA